MSTLIVITGPTGVGKTAAAIGVARALGAEIVNADSRQVYRGLSIGTAAPTAAEQALVPHHFVQCKDLDEYYSASAYEQDVLALLPRLFASSGCAVMCGGSMMYVDAVCRGIDELPSISDAVREQAGALLRDGGLDAVLAELKCLDPVYYNEVDRRNTKRVVHAVEICREAGVPYSSLRTGQTRKRPFRILKFALNLPRPELFARINARVEAMMAEGLEDEARRVLPLRHLNALNTVGYKEMFAYFDGLMDRSVAVERIKKNTRVYAKKQLTWWARDADVVWVTPATVAEAVAAALAADR